jgi:predicted nucleic acid-binding protein
VLADTSAWSLLLRRPLGQEVEAPAAAALRRFLEEGVPVFLTGLILQELLTGFRSEVRRAELLRRLEPFELLQPSRATHAAAARLADRCLRKGVTPSTIDVLIAQLALERDCTLLTADADFRGIARCARGLRLAPTQL